ncbi:MAG: DUF393 domain-containing protein [Bdellovibrionales bacterium]|nr:DUF393 domain-containing protein [Bdellovibrionales bacterium]
MINYSPVQFLLTRTLFGVLLILFPLVRLPALSPSPYIALDLFIMLLGYLCATGRAPRIVNGYILTSLMIHIFLCNPSPVLFLFSSGCIFLAAFFSLVPQDTLPYVPQNGLVNWKLQEVDATLVVFFQRLAIALLGTFMFWEWASISVEYSPLHALVMPLSHLYHPLLAIILTCTFFCTLVASISQGAAKLAWIIQSVTLLALFLLHGFALFFLPFLLLQLLVMQRTWFLAPAYLEGVIFFDGHCVLCNGWVNAVMREDFDGRWKFATLQGETALRGLEDKYREKLDSIAIQVGGQVYQRSDAVLWIVIGLGGIFRIAALGWLIPTPIRDFIYNMVAASRYRTFGKNESCRIPFAEERERMLP